MPKRNANISLSSYDDIFSTEESRAEAKQERVQEIPLSELHPFEGHPFRVVDDEDMMKTVESVREYGVLTPAIVRPDPYGGYEIISGHRRHHASELAGKETMPAIVRDMDDDAAIILMVDSNLQRETILPSERAFAYKMKLDAIKHQGARSDLTSRQVVGKLEMADVVGEQAGESGRQVQRYIRLTELIPELLDMVDAGQIKFNPAVELSHLAKQEQQDFLSAMDFAQTTPSLSQAQRIKKMSQDGECTLDAMCEVMNEVKKDTLDKVSFKTDSLRKYFPNPLIKEKMDLDIDVARLKVLKADHQSQQYRLEDKLLKYFPAQIEKQTGYIHGYEADIKTIEANPQIHEGFCGMEILGKHYAEKADAGEIILAACKEMKGTDPIPLGSFRGFQMELSFDSFRHEFDIVLKGSMSHRVALGTDARGNLTRLDNALAGVPEKLENAKEQLTNLYNQQEAAKVELGKPFPQEAELAMKSQRLAELDAALNMEDTVESRSERNGAERPSVLADLKSKSEHIPPAKRSDDREEVL